MTDLALCQAIADGDRLATHRGVDYIRVAAVFALPIDPALPPSFYALERDWPSTPVGEIAARERTIVQLQRQIAQLQAELAAAAAATAPPRPRAKLACPHCDRGGFRSAAGLSIHIGMLHKEAAEPGPAAAPPAPPPAIVAAADDPTWSCRSCGKRPGVDGAFTRSLSRPDQCFRCAADSHSRAAAEQIAA